MWDPNEHEHRLNEFAGPSVTVTHNWIRKKGAVEASYGNRTVMARWEPQLETDVFSDKAGTRIVSSKAFAFVYPAFFSEPIGESRKDE